MIEHDNHVFGHAIRFTVEPRLVPMSKAARRLHLTPKEFREKRAEFERVGFPKPCSISGHWDLKAIDGWLDQRVGVSEADRAKSASEQRRAEALAGIRARNASEERRTAGLKHLEEYDFKPARPPKREPVHSDPLDSMPPRERRAAVLKHLREQEVAKKSRRDTG